MAAKQIEAEALEALLALLEGGWVEEGRLVLEQSLCGFLGRLASQDCEERSSNCLLF